MKPAMGGVRFPLRFITVSSLSIGTPAASATLATSTPSMIPHQDTRLLQILSAIADPSGPICIVFVEKASSTIWARAAAASLPPVMQNTNGPSSVISVRVTGASMTSIPNGKCAFRDTLCGLWLDRTVDEQDCAPLHHGEQRIDAL